METKIVKQKVVKKKVIKQKLTEEEKYIEGRKKLAEKYMHNIIKKILDDAKIENDMEYLRK